MVKDIIVYKCTKYSLEGLMLKLKLQYFGHLMRRTDSFAKPLMLEKIDPSRRGLTPRGSLECNPEIPAFPGEEN